MNFETFISSHGLKVVVDVPQPFNYVNRSGNYVLAFDFSLKPFLLNDTRERALASRISKCNILNERTFTLEAIKLFVRFTTLKDDFAQNKFLEMGFRIKRKQLIADTVSFVPSAAGVMVSIYKCKKHMPGENWTEIEKLIDRWGKPGTNVTYKKRRGGAQGTINDIYIEMMFLFRLVREAAFDKNQLMSDILTEFGKYCSRLINS